jgi:hypothetical protein
MPPLGDGWSVDRIEGWELLGASMAGSTGCTPPVGAEGNRGADFALARSRTIEVPSSVAAGRNPQVQKRETDSARWRVQQKTSVKVQVPLHVLSAAAA